MEQKQTNYNKTMANTNKKEQVTPKVPKPKVKVENEEILVTKRLNRVKRFR